MTKLQQDIVKMIQRYKPPAIVAYIVDEDGCSDCIVAGTHATAVEIARRLARRMDREWQAVNERLQQDHAALHHVSPESLSAVLDEVAPTVNDEKTSAVEIDQ